MSDEQELRRRLRHIEGWLGNVSLSGMTRSQEKAVVTAWWESRQDVPVDDELRTRQLAEYAAPKREAVSPQSERSS